MKKIKIKPFLNINNNIFKKTILIFVLYIIIYVVIEVEGICIYNYKK